MILNKSILKIEKQKKSFLKKYIYILNFITKNNNTFDINTLNYNKNNSIYKNNYI